MKKFLIKLFIFFVLFFGVINTVHAEDEIDVVDDSTSSPVVEVNDNNNIVEDVDVNNDLALPQETSTVIEDDVADNTYNSINEDTIISDNSEDTNIDTNSETENNTLNSQNEIPQTTYNSNNVSTTDSTINDESNNTNSIESNDTVQTEEVASDTTEDVSTSEEEELVENDQEENNENSTHEKYEVIFSHRGYEVSIAGGTSILLSSLNHKLGINISLSDVYEILNSNNEVLNITKVDGSNDYTIKSIRSFDTEEEIIIRTKSGDEYVIKVTDPAGDIPDHEKQLLDNGDGTYTLVLTVTGDSEKIYQYVNVVVILDISASMNYSAGNSTRIAAAKTAVNNLANTLLSNNGKDGNPNDIVEIALVSFSNVAEISRTPTTSYNQFSTAVNNLNPIGGTNWEDALQKALDVDFGTSRANYPTYVIFVSDGNPTFRNTEGDYPNHNNDFNQSYYNQYSVWGSGSESNSTTVTRCYEHARDDAKALVDNGARFYTIGAYGNVDRMQSLTTYSGAPAANYYSATDTTALNNALNAILEDIQKAGIGSVAINDGTTSKVVTSTGVSHLLDVDPTSFKYYQNDVEWVITDDDLKATFNEDGEVVWDLSKLGVLDNTITYKVTFEVWPSQETLDLIADLKNDTVYYPDVAPTENVDQEGNGL
ncbi:VWA domain-containing protein [bacterium]|nr:VWA domain-containing protein [bacterium]